MALETRPNTEHMTAVRAALPDLAARLQGDLILRDDADFETARAVWNGLADRRPALIVYCADAVDVMNVVTFARTHNLAVAVRSGGHGIGGHGTCDDGVVIDLSRLKAIDIDPIRRVARIGPGLTWGEVAAALHPHGLAISSGDTASVGVGGLTLGGGIGWMVRKYGLTIDRLRAVDLVTANGRHLRVSAEEHADLFWGVRGGGGNFGIATAFEFDLHPAGTVLGGAVVYDAAEAEQILRAYARYAGTAPDELSTQALLMTAPPVPFIPVHLHGMPVVVIAVCYCGDLAEGELVVAPLRRLGAPIADVIGPMPYPALFGLTEAGQVRGLRHHVRSAFMETLGDDALHAIVTESAAIMSPETLVQVRILGGAMSRIPADATAFAHRDKPALVMITNFGPTSAEDSRLQAGTERVWRALQPYASGAYVNFLAAREPGRIHDAYPPTTYARLALLKERYDPGNLFRLNQNIGPDSAWKS